MNLSNARDLLSPAQGQRDLMPIRDLFEIQGSQAIPNIEEELAALDQQRPQRLLVPTNLTESAIGGEASLIQLIVLGAHVMLMLRL